MLAASLTLLGPLCSDDNVRAHLLALPKLMPIMMDRLTGRAEGEHRLCGVVIFLVRGQCQKKIALIFLLQCQTEYPHKFEQF